MAEKRGLESLSHAAMKHGGHARAVQARAAWEMAPELTERKAKPEEYDGRLVAYVDGSYTRCTCCKGKCMDVDQAKKRKKAMIPDGDALVGAL